MAFDLDIKVKGAEEIRRAARQLPQDLRDEIRKGLSKLSREFANRIRAAGRATPKPRGTGPGGGAVSTVRARTGLTAGVLVGPHPLLFGSEFGANGRYGWYAADKYRDSVGRQFRPHVKSYWFYKTSRSLQPEVDREAQEILDETVRRWRA